MKIKLLITLFVIIIASESFASSLPYTIVDTGQVRCYGNSWEIEYPQPGRSFFGQDAQYNGNQPAYKNNGDGTITDINTGLMWVQDPGSKKTFDKAVADATKCKVGGYNDWRLPTIKELYSLILFSGSDPDVQGQGNSGNTPFIDTKYFKFQYGNMKNGDRVIDSQFATCTKYLSTTMNGRETMFGVNFADGRIKGYPIGAGREGKSKTFYVLYVRGNTDYGKNKFVDNGDGTITDKATGLIWMKADSGKGMNWGQALKYAEKLEYAGYSDWRLPNAKELQSVADYSRCPDVTGTAAIDPIFEITAIKNEGRQKDYPFYWTSTSHTNSRGSTGVYIAFGRALGFMQNRRTENKTLMDVHGAGAQRSDPKSGSQSQFPTGRGPQGDVIRIKNYVRCVRGGVAEARTVGPKVEKRNISNRSRRNRSEFEQNNQMTDRPERMQQNQRTGQRGGQQGFINRLDKNGDGKVSKQEFDGPADHFSMFDKNNDGYISSDEAPQGPPPGRRNR